LVWKPELYSSFVYWFIVYSIDTGQFVTTHDVLGNNNSLWHYFVWGTPEFHGGSTDLTHYGDAYSFTPAGYGPNAYQWMRENDAQLLRLVEQMRASEILREASHHHNACGAGSLAATVEAARVMGAERGYLLEYTTSYDVRAESEFSMAVGYAGVLF